jgi:tRNA G37 N-methylase TrmD
MLEVPKTKLKVAVYRLRDVEKILNGYNKTNISEWRIKEAEIIVRQVSQDLLHLVEGTDLKDVEKEIERLQQSLIS